MRLPKKPKSLQCAIFLIIVGMIFEIVGIGFSAVLNAGRVGGVTVAYIVMTSSTYYTIKYVIALEIGRITSIVGIVYSIGINCSAVFFVANIGYANEWLLIAFIFDLMGTFMLLLPSTTWWIREVRIRKSE